MEILADVFLVLHFVGLASLLGGFLTQMSQSERRVNAAMIHGALTQLVTGLVLIGLLYARDLPVDNMKIGIKFVVLVVIGVLVFGFRRRVPLPTWAYAGIGALTLANIVIAVFV